MISIFCISTMFAISILITIFSYQELRKDIPNIVKIGWIAIFVYCWVMTYFVITV